MKKIKKSGDSFHCTAETTNTVNQLCSNKFLKIIYIKGEWYQFNNWTFHCNELLKEEQSKTKASRRRKWYKERKQRTEKDNRENQQNPKLFLWKDLWS